MPIFKKPNGFTVKPKREKEFPRKRNTGRKVYKGPTQINGHKFVAMGDGLKWATCNIGASKPEEHGDFFIWGETEPCYSSFDPLIWKEDQMYAYETSKYFTHESPINAIKYNGPDGKTVLEPSDDAATSNWGDTWRMPTAKEFEKLLDENLFTWEKTTVNGVEGFTVTSKVEGYEGNSIFFPFTKHFKARSLTSIFPTSAYWTSELVPPSDADDVKCEYAHILDLDWGANKVGFHARCWGFPIRPVSL